MSQIKTLKNHAFRWTLVALLSAMFVVLLSGYWWHIEQTNQKLSQRTEPLENITTTILAQSGSSDDSLTRSHLASIEQQISGLDLTPSLSNSLRRYIGNLYTVAGAFDAAKQTIPQTNDWHYLFDKGTIDLLHTNSLLSWDVLTLYSGRQIIQDAITHLSGATISTTDRIKKQMSTHNLSVALASQIGVEVLVCTKSYDALAQSRQNVSTLFSGLIQTYTNQLSYLSTLTGNDENFFQCISAYRQQLNTNISQINQHFPTINKLNALSTSRQRTYNTSPLQCPLGIDLRQDIIDVRTYEQETNELLSSNQHIENMLATGSLQTIQEICQTATSEQEWSGHSLDDLLSVFTGSQQQLMQQPPQTTWANSNTGSFTQLPEETRNIINDIYENNTKYIDLMQQTKQDKSYNPLRRIQQLFQEFYGDTEEFTR